MDFPPGAWLDGVSVVVQPAFVEEAPRRLIEALATGTPVVATAACGLDPQPGLTLVPAGDATALCAAVARSLRPGVQSAQSSSAMVTVSG
ncbi:MAG: glycosyltransferase [Caulobacterales bacterium]